MIDQQRMIAWLDTRINATRNALTSPDLSTKEIATLNGAYNAYVVTREMADVFEVLPDSKSSQPQPTV